MANLLSCPRHSFIKQSDEVLQLSPPLNGNGAGWCVSPLDPIPGRFTNMTPPGSNQNLLQLADKISTSYLFGHGRAASPGRPVREINRRRSTSAGLSGCTTAPAPMFPKSDGDRGIHTVTSFFLPSGERLIADTHFLCSAINGCRAKRGLPCPSSGRPCTRRSSRSTRWEAHSAKFGCKEEDCQMQPAGRGDHAMRISSEPLTGMAEEWQEIPPNTLLASTADFGLEIMPIA